MILVTTLIASQALTFVGGPVQDLTGTLSAWSDGVAVTLLDDGGSYRPFKIAAKVAGNPKDVARLALARGGVVLSISQSGVGASRGIYAMEARVGYPATDVWLSKRGQRVEKIPDNAFIEGRVNLTTGPDRGITLRELSREDFTKPLRVHWLYERMAVAVQAKETDEKNFLKVLASAVGAKLVDKGPEYRLDFDPAAVREFAARTVEHSISDPHDPAAYLPYRQLSSRLAALAWRQASLDVINRAFKNDGVVAGYKPSRSSPLVPLMRQKLRLMMQLAEDPSVDKSRRELLNTQLGIADLNGEPRIILAPDLVVAIALPAKAGGTIIL